MKLLVVRVGAMGDVLHALPAVAGLRAVRPDWTVDWVVDPRWAPLLVDATGRGPLVHGVYTAETKLWSGRPFSLRTARSVGRLLRGLRREHFDVVADMQGTMRSAFLAGKARAGSVTGYAFPRERLATWYYGHKAARRGDHVVEHGAALLAEATGINFPLLTSAPVPFPHEAWADNWAAEQAEPSAGGRGLCLLAPGAGWGAKQWPAVNFSRLARELRDAGYDVVVNAPHQDNPTALSVVEGSGGAARMVVCNVAGLLALLRRSALLVGGDSGPTHLAAALGIPLVALFGPTNPARNGPWGPGPMRVLRHAESTTSHKRVDPVEPGLARLRVDEVVEAVDDLGAETAPPSVVLRQRTG